MTKEQKEELKAFLMFLDLKNTELTPLGIIAIQQIHQKYPQFDDIKKENEKLFKWIDKEKSNE